MIRLKKLLILILSVVLMLTVFSLSSSALLSPRKPSGIKTDSVSSDSVSLSWKKVFGADFYRVYVRRNEEWKALGDTTSVTFTAGGLVASKNYTFAVSSVNKSGGKNYYSDEKATIDVKTKELSGSVLSATSGVNFVKLKWSRVPGATGYKVYMQRNGEWEVIQKLSSAKLNYTVKGLSYDTLYRFAIKAYTSADGKPIDGPPSGIVGIRTFKANKVTLNCTANTSSTVTLKWTKANDATGYRVYRCVGDRLKIVATINSRDITTKKLTSLKSDSKYTFRVRAFRKNGNNRIWFVASKDLSVTTDPTSNNLNVYRTKNLKEILNGKSFTMTYTTQDKDYGKIPVILSKRGTKYRLHTKVNEMEYIILNRDKADYVILNQRKAYIKVPKILESTVDIKKTVDTLVPGKGWSGTACLAEFAGKKVVCETYTNELKTKKIRYYYRAGELVGIREYSSNGKLSGTAYVVSLTKSSKKASFSVPKQYKKIA